MNKKVKYTIWAFVAVLLFLLVINIIRYLNADLSYSVADKATVEQMFSGEAILIRNEKTIPVSGGVFESVVVPGTRVSGRSLIGYLYKGTLNSETEQRLRNLNEQIAQLTAGSAFSDAHVSSVPGEVALSEAYALMAKINAGEYNQVSTSALGVKMALNQQKKKDEKTDFDQQLALLRAEKADIERSISAVRENVYSPFGGVFSEHIDGYENVLPVNGLKSLLPSQLKETKPIHDSGESVKLIDNSEWFLALNTPSINAEKMYVGMPVSVRFLELSETAVQATVYALNVEEEECCVVLSCSQTLPGIFDYRQTEVEIITSSKTGFRIPSTALRMQGEEQGVYVVRENLARFVPVEIVLQEEEFMLVSTVTSGGIKLYDEVITTGNVEEGMLVR